MTEREPGRGSHDTFAKNNEIVGFNKDIKPGLVGDCVNRSTHYVGSVVLIAVPDLDAERNFTGKYQGNRQNTFRTLSLAEGDRTFEKNAAAAEVAEKRRREAIAALYAENDVFLDGIGNGISFFPSLVGSFSQRTVGGQAFFFFIISPHESFDFSMRRKDSDPYVYSFVADNGKNFTPKDSNIPQSHRCVQDILESQDQYYDNSIALPTSDGSRADFKTRSRSFTFTGFVRHSNAPRLSALI